MARLEDLGYVQQPHTSAGRVPTDLGYRNYVDVLLSERRTPRATPQMEARLRRAASVEDLMTHLSHELSRASHQVGFAIAPGVDATTLERLDFVPLDGGRVLVIVVGTGGHISHKVIEPSDDYDHTELQQAANYLNSEFKGQSLLAGAAGRARSAARGADALRRPACARAPAGELDVRRPRLGADAVRAGRLAPSGRGRRRIRSSRSRRCERCCG